MKKIIVAFFFSLVLTGLACSRFVGYANPAEVQIAFPDYVVVGTFGKAWPARIVRTQDGENGVVFTRKDGQKHDYGGFVGYSMRAIFLENRSGEESIVVLRSAEKTSGETPNSEIVNTLKEDYK